MTWTASSRRLFAERARQEAVRLNREGRYDDAGKPLDGVRKRIAAYAGSDPELREIVAELRDGGARLRGRDAGDGPASSATSRPATSPGCGRADGKSIRNA